MSPAPTILIIPGAFLHPSCFDTFVSHLHRAGYPTFVATVPSSNPSSPETTTCVSDTLFLREKYLIPLIDDEGKDVLLLLHSYGGLIGGAAACGFSVTQRAAAGKLGGVIGLAYLSGNIVGEGVPMLQIVGGEFPPFIKTDKVNWKRELAPLSLSLSLSLSLLSYVITDALLCYLCTAAISRVVGDRASDSNALRGRGRVRGEEAGSVDAAALHAFVHHAGAGSGMGRGGFQWPKGLYPHASGLLSSRRVSEVVGPRDGSGLDCEGRGCGAYFVREQAGRNRELGSGVCKAMGNVR